VLWTYVIAFGDKEEGRDFEGQRHAEVLLAHPNQTRIRAWHGAITLEEMRRAAAEREGNNGSDGGGGLTDDKACVVGHVTCQSVGCRAKVALMAREVNQSHNLTSSQTPTCASSGRGLTV
jgi:hypothetical protein